MRSVPSVRAPAIQIYDHPVIQKRPKGGDVVLDKFGRIIPESSMFLIDLYESAESDKTYVQYRSQVLLFERFRSAYAKGAGLPYDQLGDAFLKDLRSYRIKIILVSTFLGAASLWFRMFQFIQDNGWTKHLIGPASALIPYRIRIPSKGKHFFLKGKRVITIPKLPTHEDLDLIDEQVMALAKDENIKERWALILKTLRRIPLRGSEVFGITVDQIPTRAQLKRLRSRLTRLSKPLGLNVPVTRAKKGGVRDAFFPLSLLDEYREYIDLIRPKLVRDGGEPKEVFLSAKTGNVLKRQSLTNIYKIAAGLVSDVTPRAVGEYLLAKARPHILRHRAITDYVRNYLVEGMGADRALMTVMEVAGIKNIEVAARYVHIAEDELAHAAPEFVNATNKIEQAAASRLVNSYRTGNRKRYRTSRS